jgi:ribosome-associated protein
VTPDELAAHLAERGEFAYSRASGPGGQRRDHVETRVALTLTRDAVADLPSPLADRVAAVLRLDDGPLRLRSERERSRERNRDALLDDLAARVAPALAPPPPPRRPTRPTRAARERRLADKQRRSDTKRLRRTPPGDH